MAQRPQVFDGTVTITSSGAVLVGAFVVSGDSILVALNAASASGQLVTYRVLGRIDGVAKLSTDVVAVGHILYWDAGNSRLTTTASSHKRAGRAASAAGNGVTTVDLILGL
jgi:predicted RecA/RadA family phage recombinase